jgi:hypothetical protein
LKKKEDSIETDTDYEHSKAKDHLTQQHRNSKNSNNNKNYCIQTFLQGLIPTGDQKTKTGKKKLLHLLGHHKEAGQEATSKKHVVSLNT